MGGALWPLPWLGPCMDLKRLHVIIHEEVMRVLPEGGPGSGVARKNTRKINKFMEKYGCPSCATGPITVGKRGQFMDCRNPKSATVPLSKITHVGQETYVPTKLTRMMKTDDVDDMPIQLLRMGNGNYQVIDGHHRYLKAVANKRDSLPAEVYVS